jgi:hypothetical protein
LQYEVNPDQEERYLVLSVERFKNFETEEAELGMKKTT